VAAVDGLSDEMLNDPSDSSGPMAAHCGGVSASRSISTHWTI